MAMIPCTFLLKPFHHSFVLLCICLIHFSTLVLTQSHVISHLMQCTIIEQILCIWVMSTSCLHRMNRGVYYILPCWLTMRLQVTCFRFERPNCTIMRYVVPIIPTCSGECQLTQSGKALVSCSMLWL